MVFDVSVELSFWFRKFMNNVLNVVVLNEVLIIWKKVVFDVVMLRFLKDDVFCMMRMSICMDNLMLVFRMIRYSDCSSGGVYLFICDISRNVIVISVIFVIGKIL